MSNLTYTTQTNLKSIEQILQFANKHNCPIIEFEGVLNDIFIIKNTAHIKLNQQKVRKHIICYYKYHDNYNNDLYVTSTDNWNVIKKIAANYNILIDDIFDN